MSESAPAVPQSGTLQFDTAEPAADRACVLCKQRVGGVYHLANGNTVCSPCRVKLEAHRAGSGSRVLRFGKAMTFGLGAAVAGWLIYYAILKIANLELSLVAILVGYMVGRAMYIGSGRRGGRAYQVMAVVMTYLAMAFTYVPFIIEGLSQNAHAGSTPVTRLLTAIVMAPAMPFITVAENPLGIVILGIGVWQAWKTTARTEIAFTGPHQVPQPAPLPAPAAVPAFE